MNIRERSIQFAWHSQALSRLRAELDALMQAGAAPDIPAEPGGWWHHYVCPRHHTELRYDPLERDAHSFACPHGCQLQGEPYRGAWLVFKHQAMARCALQGAAVFAATRKPEYARFSYGILLRYAEQFPRYPVHPGAEPWMLKGRAFHQALTEAIWATTMMRAYLLLSDEQAPVPEEWAAQPEAWPSFVRLLAGSLEQAHCILTRERQQPESNYTAWLNAALCSVYAAAGEERQLLRVLAGEGGYRQHLSLAIRPDQLEYEGSIYYHLFVLRAYMITGEMAARWGHDLYAERGTAGQSLEGMLDVTAGLAAADGQLPAFHDGPYSREPYAREIAEVFEQGYARYGKPVYANIAACAYQQMYGSRHRNGLEAVLYGVGEWPVSGASVIPGSPLSGIHRRQSAVCADSVSPSATASSTAPALSSAPAAPAAGTHGEMETSKAGARLEASTPHLLPDSGFAVLRHNGNPLYAIIDFGPHGGSHGHFDKLNLMLYHRDYPLSPDRGTVPYGSHLKKQWYPHTACHNTVSIGQRSQLESTGESRKFVVAQDYSYSWTRTSQSYEGVVMDRHLWMTSEWLLDWFEIRTHAEGENVPKKDSGVDWWFHFLGKASDMSCHPNGEGGRRVPIQGRYPQNSVTGVVPDLEASGHAERQELGDREGKEAWKPLGNSGNSDGYRFVHGHCLSGSQAAAGFPEAGSGQWSFVIRQTTQSLRSQTGTVFDDSPGRSTPEPVAVTLWQEANSELWEVRSPGIAIDPTVPMEGMLLRQKGTAARFVAIYSAGNIPVGMEWEDDGTLRLAGKSTLGLRLTSDGLQLASVNEKGGKNDEQAV
ncbi:heparinase II/III domain-containing protein [Paenibacillus senegalensis]|uniref:heparinase II/III domain-containing protein n=1 Tax=Paenibacillus senegalensis TaxID=1465766 RepID=UPI0002898327|nr:heparinase II/III family protein [Paenibacillus senegalensis]